MGGSHCEIPWKAAVRSTDVPTRKGDQHELEAQLRQAFQSTDVIKGVVERGHDEEVCLILSKEDLTPQDLSRLLAIGKSLWANYDYPKNPSSG